MNFTLEESIEILERTPDTISSLTTGLSDDWIYINEGSGTWTVPEVIDHLIEADRTNWLSRLTHILEEGETKPFPAFDRFAHLQGSPPESIQQKLNQFSTTRKESLATLKHLNLTNEQLETTGAHPAFGVVKARELLATWAIHDLTHISQIVRIMANRYREDVGPWKEYLSVLK